MASAVQGLRDRWRRRNWRPVASNASFATLRPVTVITGASRGIGQALAGEFARAGHDLLLVARGGDALAQVAAKLAPAGVTIETLAADLATQAGCEAIAASLSSKSCYCNILVNNAGMGLGGPLADQPLDALSQLLNLNIGAVTHLTRQFLPGMMSRGTGGILNVASLGGYIPGPYQAAYYASKAYVISLTEAIADETAGSGIRISALIPGPVATTFHASMGTENSYYLNLIGVMSAEDVAKAGFRGFRQGKRLVYPGVLHHINAAVLSVLPRWLIVPVVGWMLRQRQAG